MMKYLVALLTLVALVGAGPIVSLDGTYIGPGAQVLNITASGTTVIKPSAGRFYEIINESVLAQPAGLCTWNDGTTNAGPQLYAENGIGPSQIILMFWGYGLPVASTLSVTCAIAPTTGILVVYT